MKQKKMKNRRKEIRKNSGSKNLPKGKGMCVGYELYNILSWAK